MGNVTAAKTSITLSGALHSGATQLSASTTARRDAEVLLLHVTGLTRAMLLTYPDRRLTEAQWSSFRSAIARRAKHEPVQYITGAQEFYGRPFLVSPAVLIPRPETEHLIEAVLAIRPHPQHILDIGTGSGILAITLALELPHAAVTAADISLDALRVAQGNAEALGVVERVRFVASDLLGVLPGERFDCVVSNPPYVSEGERLEPQVRDYEPALALSAGKDGLAIYRLLIPQAAQALLQGGSLLIEIGYGQRDAVDRLLHAAGFRDIRFVDDLQAIPRVACARAP